MKQSTLSKWFLALTSLSALLGLILITYINVRDNPTGRIDFSLSNVISYFTIQSNILVALVTGYFFFYGRKFTKFENLITFGTLINIFITGVVYTLILAGVWEPKGLLFIANALLHYSTPLLFTMYFFLLMPKKELSYKIPRYWFLYPVLYFVYTLIRGSITGFYPYPFIDASKLTTWELIVNAIAMGVFFLLIGALFTWINNQIVVRQKSN